MARVRDRDLGRTQAPLQGKDEDMGSLGTGSCNDELKKDKGK